MEEFDEVRGALRGFDLLRTDELGCVSVAGREPENGLNEFDVEFHDGLNNFNRCATECFCLPTAGDSFNKGFHATVVELWKLFEILLELVELPDDIPFCFFVQTDDGRGSPFIVLIISVFEYDCRSDKSVLEVTFEKNLVTLWACLRSIYTSNPRDFNIHFHVTGDNGLS